MIQLQSLLILRCMVIMDLIIEYDRGLPGRIRTSAVRSKDSLLVGLSYKTHAADLASAEVSNGKQGIITLAQIITL